MENYIVNYNTGAGNDYAETLSEAMTLADEGARYTQQPITITQDGDTVATRPWWGCMDGINEMDDPIYCGDRGFYGDWIMA